MGKKDKNTEIFINDTELEPTTIGYLEDTNESPVGLIILFTVFIIFAILLPYITGFVNDLFDKEDKKVTPIVEPTVDDDNKEETPEIVMYDFNSELSFKINDITFKSFNKYGTEEGYYLSFNMSNSGKENIDFSNTKYFIESYNSEKMLISRHIFSNNILSPGTSLNEIIEINQDEYNSLEKIIISEKNTNDYSDITLNADNTLTCSNDINSILYTFNKDGKLESINDTVNFANNNATLYNIYLNQYKTLVTNYNNQNGVKSNIIEVSSGFTVTTNIKTSDANIKNLKNDNYYNNETTAKVVKFEMESRGYSCS